MADTYQLKALLTAVDNLSPVLKSVQGVAKNTRKYLGDLGASVGNLGSKLGLPIAAIGALGAGFGFLAIKKAVGDFAALGEEVQKGALKAGMSNAQYQQMKYVTDQAGVSIEGMQMSMGKLNKNIGAAASGKGDDLVQLLKTLHIPLKGVNGQARSAADLLPQLADAFVRNKDPVKQAAIGTALFGKAYQEMLPLLNEGSEGIEKSLARFGKLKGVISDDDLKGAKEFGDQLKDLSFVTKGFQMTIAKELVPVLSPVIESFIMWAAANKKLIAIEVKQAVQGIVEAIKQIDWPAFIAGVQSTIAGIAKFVDDIGGAKNALIGLFVLMNLQGVAAALSLAGAIGRLGMFIGAPFIAGLVTLFSTLAGGTLVVGGMSVSFGALALAALPFIGIAVAIGAAAYLIYKNWEPLKAWFGEFFDWIGDKFAWAAGIAGKIGSAVGGFFSGGSTATAAAIANSPGGNTAAAIARQPAVGAAPGQLGSGSFNINAAPVASLNGKVDIDFKNAPPGMMVTQAKADGPRVAMNTNVGYRTLGAEGNW